MSGNAFLRDLVSDVADAFADIGACVVGRYTAPEGRPQLGRLFINRGVYLTGPQGQVIYNRVTIDLVAGDFENPGEVGAAIEVEGESFIVDSVIPTESGTDGAITVLVREAAP